MKGSLRLIAPLIIIFFLTSCMTTGLNTPTLSVETLVSLPSSVPPKSTPIQIPTNTKTIIPSLMPLSSPTQTALAVLPPTLEPEQSIDTIKASLQKSGNCATPCFLGIEPGHTSLNEVRMILSHLGLGLDGPEHLNKSYLFGTSINSDSGLLILTGLTVSDEIVTDVEITISPEKQKAGTEREWLAYSPETLIKSYGQPSRIDLLLGRADTHTALDMIMYFDEIGTIIEYYISNITSNKMVCPLLDQFDTVRLWIGENPSTPPLSGEPLEKTTDLTLESFSQLMTGDRNEACFNIKVDMFP